MRLESQGLGHPWAVRAFGEILQEQKPDMVFLMETKLKNSQVNRLKERFNFFGISIAATGKSGGLALLWKKDIRVDIQTYSRNHIDPIIFMDSDSPPWRFTGCYGEPIQTQRHKTWSLLTWLSTKSTIPWLCLGDFNEILHESEKQGDKAVPNWRIRNFRNATLEAGLTDLGFTGFEAMWVKYKECEKLIRDNWTHFDGDGKGCYIVFAMSQCKTSLLKWKRLCGKCYKKVRKIGVNFMIFALKPRGVGSKTEENRIEQLIGGLMDKEELLWRQRGRHSGFVKGIKTQLFSMLADGKKAQQSIIRLKNDNGIGAKHEMDIEKLHSHTLTDCSPLVIPPRKSLRSRML
ncbi:hypothetical protein DH2020_043225 [Rehmannia glutinosa]|uniref:Endonuclease/exonuclease/phosphatase domain-containing protein n=1 Tax=Rehmannia glutinosa TaxID=99300 RepID=A0ABR0UL70_REHGL